MVQSWMMPPFNGGRDLSDVILDPYRNSGRNCYNMNCLKPKLIYNKYLGRNLFVPCGRCDNCRIQHSVQLIPRVINECESAVANVFFTLTYNNDHIPYIFKRDMSYYFHDANGDDVLLDDFKGIDFFFNISPCNIYHKENMRLLPDLNHRSHRSVLCKYDVRMFIKRVRAYLKYHLSDFVPFYESKVAEIKSKLEFYESEYYDFEFKRLYKEVFSRYYEIRYFVCGEYGTSNHRPHFHGIFHCQTFETAEFLTKAICACWSYCDWDKVSRIKGRDGRSGLPSLVGSSASAYVSSYVNSVDYKFPLSQYFEFKPFVLYSRKPIYGLSQLDKDIEQKIFDGVDYNFEQNAKSKSGKDIVIKCSSLLERKIFARLPNFNLYTFEDICALLLRPFLYSSSGIRNFVTKCRNIIFKKYGYINSSSVNDYLTKIFDFLRRFASFRLRSQMLEFNPSHPIDYVKKQFQTFSDFFMPSVASFKTVLNVCTGLCYRLFSFIDAYRDSLPLSIVLESNSLDSLFDVFRNRKQSYYERYCNYLTSKHSHSLNSNYYATI